MGLCPVIPRQEYSGRWRHPSLHLRSVSAVDVVKVIDETRREVDMWDVLDRQGLEMWAESGGSFHPWRGFPLAGG